VAQSGSTDDFPAVSLCEVYRAHDQCGRAVWRGGIQSVRGFPAVSV